MKRDLKFEAWYEFPPEVVWSALTDREAMSEWLMPNDFEPRVGHKFTLRTKPAPGFDGIVRCEIKEISPPRRLSYSWEGGGIDTLVTFSLTPSPGGTHVVLEHTGFRGFRGLMVSAILGQGWRKKILPIGLLAAVRQMSETAHGVRD
ncbi:MAG TPA: SRPBCC domain-containing protein [Pyrinomonadaceae bacterium]|nr:SRPBCC domain-containing protein [Pyrinomonadaceae bacterium]